MKNLSAAPVSGVFLFMKNDINSTARNLPSQERSDASRYGGLPSYLINNIKSKYRRFYIVL
jgi:hypothetical protein